MNSTSLWDFDKRKLEPKGLYDHERYLKEIQEQAIFMFYCRLDTREELFYIRFWDCRPVFDLTPRVTLNREVLGC